MSEEDESTHSMVAGLHRRFGIIEMNVATLAQDSKATSERMIRMEGRIDLAEANAKSTAEREILIHNNVKEALANTNSIVKKLFDKFDAHTVEESKDRLQLEKDGKKIMVWLVSTCISVLIGIGMVMFTQVFTK